MYLLDTNACVDYLSGRFPGVVRRLASCAVDEVWISSVVAAELRHGADESAHPKRNHARLDDLLRELRRVPFDDEAARAFGRVRAELERAGSPIGPYDMLIAAHALSAGSILVTDNLREFERVRGLRVESWR